MRRGLLREARVSRKDFFAPKKNHEEAVRPLCPVDRVMSRCHAQSGCNHLDIHPRDEHNRKLYRAREISEQRKGSEKLRSWEIISYLNLLQ